MPFIAIYAITVVTLSVVGFIEGMSRFGLMGAIGGLLAPILTLNAIVWLVTKPNNETAPPSYVSLCRFKNHAEAAENLHRVLPDLHIGEEDMKRLTTLHFFGWVVIPGSERFGFPLTLVRGTENRIFTLS
ncbi:hypothetical protein [Pseudomonas sp. NPDC089569]|uniref:hypothetical protein n=1 Tax=Pseudomonas sp. NPDC089569 TaxID=3390722 RepID=UPI003D05A400